MSDQGSDDFDLDDVNEAALARAARADRIVTWTLIVCTGGWSASAWLPAPLSYWVSAICLLAAILAVLFLGAALRNSPADGTPPYLRVMMWRLAIAPMTRRIVLLGAIGIAACAVGLPAALLWPGPEVGALVPAGLGLLWIAQANFRQRNALLRRIAADAEALSI